MRRAAVLAALALAPLLAGCTGGHAGPAAVPPVSPGLPAAALTEGGFYAFAHGGGPLTFRLDGQGDAAFDLYGGDDVRLGSVGFTSETTRTGFHRIDGVPPGDLVLRVQTLNGTLRVESGEEPIARFQPLGVLVERIVLASTDTAAADPFGLGLAVALDPQPVDDRVDVQLRRAPADLRLLGTGLWSNLSVQVRSERGVVLDAQDLGGAVGAFSQQRSLDQLPAETTLQNVRGGALEAQVRADDLHGAVVLESWSYSRAGLPTPATVGESEAAFTYGPLSATPSAFAVHPDATRLLLWQADGRAGAPATVALFDGADRRIATVLVPARGVVEVGVTGGADHVAVLLAGNATLGVDRAPPDFDLRPLEVQDLVVPGFVAGDAGRGLYAIASEDVEAPTAFAFAATVLESGQQPFDGGTGLPDSFPGACDVGRFLRIDHGGEAVLTWHEGVQPGEPTPAPVLQGGQALSAGTFTITHDGFGDDGCGRPAIAIRSYVRQV